MNVGNIMPADEIEIKLSYTELLVPTDGVYEFVFPTVVGPRYSNEMKSENEGKIYLWKRHIYWKGKNLILVMILRR